MHFRGFSLISENPFPEISVTFLPWMYEKPWAMQEDPNPTFPPQLNCNYRKIGALDFQGKSQCPLPPPPGTVQGRGGGGGRAASLPAGQQVFMGATRSRSERGVPATTHSDPAASGPRPHDAPARCNSSGGLPVPPPHSGHARRGPCPRAGDRRPARGVSGGPVPRPGVCGPQRRTMAGHGLKARAGCGFTALLKPPLFPATLPCFFGDAFLPRTLHHRQGPQTRVREHSTTKQEVGPPSAVVTGGLSVRG